MRTPVNVQYQWNLGTSGIVEADGRISIDWNSSTSWAVGLDEIIEKDVVNEGLWNRSGSKRNSSGQKNVGTEPKLSRMASMLTRNVLVSWFHFRTEDSDGRWVKASSLPTDGVLFWNVREVGRKKWVKRTIAIRNYLLDFWKGFMSGTRLQPPNPSN